MPERRKISSALKAFQDELVRLQKLDDTNHRRFYAGRGRPSAERLTKDQMHLLTEAILARAFSRYEECLEQMFLLYCQGKKTNGGRTVGSFLNPRNLDHARSLLKSNMNFLEWNDPDKIISRCEIYLHQDSPIHMAVSSNRARLNNIRAVRNAIAHASSEAEARFQRAVKAELSVAPLRSPTPGEFLMMGDRLAPPRTYLRSYLSVLSNVAQIAAG